MTLGIAGSGTSDPGPRYFGFGVWVLGFVPRVTTTNRSSDKSDIGLYVKLSNGPGRPGIARQVMLPGC